MKPVTSAITLALFALATGGCQGMFGDTFFASRSQPVELDAEDLSDYFAQRLEAGRNDLAHNRPALAIVAFRQASYDPAHSAKAYNGMAIAYVQIGRADLAERYFNMAIAADPTDIRIARNFARFTGASGLEEAEPQFAVHALPTGGVDADEMRLAGAANEIQETNSPMVRISPREVRISATAERGAIRSTPEGKASARALRGTEYPVRVALPTASVANKQQYPVRIALSDVKVAPRAAYPIRIELPRAN